MGSSSGSVRPLYELLKELTTTDLNDRIVSLPSFQCKICDKLLLPPIRLVDGLGNVCGKCEVEDASKTILFNYDLEVILQNLAIPCPNKLRGCNEHFDYFDILPHLAACPNRNYHCPYNVLEHCDWEGGSSFIAVHCYEEHLDYVIQPNGNTFHIRIDIKSTNDLVRLLNIDNDKFIVHIKNDLQSSSLYYIMYYLGNPDEIKDFSFIIEQVENKRINNCCLQYESNKIIPYNINFSLDVDVENALKIDLPLLEQFVSGSTVEAVLKIIPKTNKSEIIDETLLSIFECPICNNFMKPPIYQCLSGHSLCNYCRPKLGQCPTCRAGFGNTRNYSLESLGHRTKFPCLYRDLGCRIVMAASEIVKHEVECNVKPYTCPFLEVKKCLWEGVHSSLATHLTRQHSDKTKSTNCVELRALVSYESVSDFYCLIYNGDIFRVCHKYDRGNHNIYWAVQYVGPRGEAKNYKYEISMSDRGNENRKLTRTDVCQELSNYDYMFKQCIVLPINLLFSNNEGILYCCKITKIGTV